MTGWEELNTYTVAKEIYMAKTKSGIILQSCATSKQKVKRAMAHKFSMLPSQYTIIRVKAQPPTNKEDRKMTETNEQLQKLFRGDQQGYLYADLVRIINNDCDQLITEDHIEALRAENRYKKESRGSTEW